MRKPAAIRAFAATVASCGCALVFAAGAEAAGSGGVGPGGTTPTTNGPKAKLTKDGQAVAPAGAPKAVKRAIAAGNSIDDAGYCSGGGHGNWNDRCYDCSGTVSYVLGPKGANVLKSPLPSGDFKRWGEPGKGSQITVYYNGGHAFVAIAGLRLDTSIPDDGNEGPGWSKDVKAGLVNGPFKKRHPAGL